MELQKGIKTAEQVSLELTPVEREMFDALKVHIKHWSIGPACRRAGITQLIHTKLLKKPEYAEFINNHKKQFKQQSWTEYAVIAKSK